MCLIYMYLTYSVISNKTASNFDDFAHFIEGDYDARIEINDDPLTILRKGCQGPQHQLG